MALRKIKNMSNIYEKIEEYLRKEFPGKRLIRVVNKEYMKNAEPYGFMGAEIAVLQEGSMLFYQVIKK